MAWLAANASGDRNDALAIENNRSLAYSAIEEMAGGVASQHQREKPAMTITPGAQAIKHQWREAAIGGENGVAKISSAAYLDNQWRNAAHGGVGRKRRKA